MNEKKRELFRRAQREVFSCIEARICAHEFLSKRDAQRLRYYTFLAEWAAGKTFEEIIKADLKEWLNAKSGFQIAVYSSATPCKRRSTLRRSTRRVYVKRRVTGVVRSDRRAPRRERHSAVKRTDDNRGSSDGDGGTDGEPCKHCFYSDFVKIVPKNVSTEAALKNCTHGGRKSC